MKNKWHKSMTIEKWQNYPIEQQILMIGSEFARAQSFIKQKDLKEVGNCYERAFELLDLCCNDLKWRSKLRELTRFREILGESYLFKRNDLKLNNTLFKILLFWNKETSNVKI